MFAPAYDPDLDPPLGRACECGQISLVEDRLGPPVDIFLRVEDKRDEYRILVNDRIRINWIDIDTAKAEI